MAKVFEPRDWQQECFDKAWDWLVTKGEDRHFLVNATPGAGKTLMGAWLARKLINAGKIKRVVVIAPRVSVVNAWAKDFQRLTGRPMMKLTGTGKGMAKVQPDICATWSAISGILPEMQAVCAAAPTLVICDEHHHAAFRAAWGDDANDAFTKAKYVLALTGTPLRSDGAGIQWFELDDHGRLAIPEGGSYTLSYKRAIEARYCQPMVFHRHTGEFHITVKSTGQSFIVRPGLRGVETEHEIGLDILKQSQWGKLVRLAHVTDDGTPVRPSYHQSMIRYASEKLDDLRERPEAEGGLVNAACLVAAPTIPVAKYLARLIEIEEGEPPFIVYTGMDSAGMIEAFQQSNSRWIVAVNMISEGVDIPRLRVIINLSRAETELYFRQLAGRAIRSCGPDDRSRAYMVMPVTPAFDEFAANYEEEQGPIPPQPQPRKWRCRACKHMNDVALDNCEECGEPRRRKPEPPEPEDWTCEACGALNGAKARTCHACGQEPPGVDVVLPPLPQYDYTIDDANGDRDGIWGPGGRFNEAEVKKGEELAKTITEFDRHCRPGYAKYLLSRFMPEELARLRETLAEAEAWQAEQFTAAAA